MHADDSTRSSERGSARGSGLSLGLVKPYSPNAHQRRSVRSEFNRVNTTDSVVIGNWRRKEQQPIKFRLAQSDAWEKRFVAMTGASFFVAVIVAIGFIAPGNYAKQVSKLTSPKL